MSQLPYLVGGGEQSLFSIPQREGNKDSWSFESNILHAVCHVMQPNLNFIINDICSRLTSSLCRAVQFECECSLQRGGSTGLVTEY